MANGLPAAGPKLIALISVPPSVRLSSAREALAILVTSVLLSRTKAHIGL